MEEKLEEVVEKTTQETSQQDSGDENVVKVDESKFKSAGDDDIIKVDLSKPPTPKKDEVKENNPDDQGVVAVADNADTPQEQEKVQPEAETQETPVLEEITEEENVEVEEIAVEASEAIKESIETGEPLPDNIQKLMDFMEDTGGDLNDYVKLNQDYSELDSQDLLREHYKQTKPHLDNEEINFLMEDQFSYDEDVDSDREIKRKKLALKEQVANAKTQLEENKSKYYEEIKSGSKLTEEQQKAINFFNRYSEEEAESKKGNEQRVAEFQEKTKNVFNDKFKGFEYNVGEKKFRYNVQDANKVQDTQSDINNFIGKFLDKNNIMTDAEGYHKSLFTAMNPDAIAKHFYEQGQSDAIKTSVEKGKNISMEPRQAHGAVDTGGIKVRVLGDDAPNFKFKIKNNKFKN